jgi:hypothetical protein
VRDELDRADTVRRRPAPGLDLTRYPDRRNAGIDEEEAPHGSP